MKINMIKMPGGTFVPATDLDQEKTKKYKSNLEFEVDIPLRRNPAFHGKMFSFFRFCFEYWASDREFMDEAGQFEVFRNNLTVNAGYYNEYFNLKGEVRIEAKSLSYASMSQEEFERCYSAVVGAALRCIFAGCDDPNIENRLLSFFN
jgi:hypothetical protein